jgi:hypothetical protein
MGRLPSLFLWVLACCHMVSHLSLLKVQLGSKVSWKRHRSTSGSSSWWKVDESVIRKVLGLNSWLSSAPCQISVLSWVESYLAAAHKGSESKPDNPCLLECIASS